MNGNRCVWLCGGSWRFGPMWHFYCLGDLGQWSTSGTSHNRVHMSTAIRHPTRQAERERERERQGQRNIWVLSFPLVHTHTHKWACIWDSVLFKVAWLPPGASGLGWGKKGGVESEFDWQPWTRMFPVSGEQLSYWELLFCLLFLLRALPLICFCSLIFLYSVVFCCCNVAVVGKKCIYWDELKQSGQLVFVKQKSVAILSHVGHLWVMQ